MGSRQRAGQPGTPRLLGKRPTAGLAPIGWPSGQLPVLPVPLSVCDGVAHIGLGDRLLVLKSPDVLQTVELNEVILTLAASAPYSRRRVVAGLEQGAAVCWTDSAQPHVERFARDLVSPVVGFSLGGRLVAADADHGEIYRTSEHAVHLEARLPGTGVRPLAALPTARINQFALIYENGLVRWYRIPR